ncbi:MAG TPA: undecaprenyl-diphosphatase UppP [Gemmatimonadaceae bacterium]|nr:undecaprenyl-diphosphatase UppP [Gemmatimonadaceae bacterium]
MSLLQAIVLGIVQGLTEFLPVSSSAHLALVPWAFGWQDPGLAFDVALHVGTLLAVLWFFSDEWLRLIRSALSIVTTRNVDTPEKRRVLFLIVATIPGGIAGLVLEKYAESYFRSPTLIAVVLIALGVILWLVDKVTPQVRSMDEMTWGQAIALGVAQCFALVPGVSRSGSTITAGRALGFNRESAAVFSFLMSMPITAGAALKEVPKALHQHGLSAELLVGVLASAVSGWLAITVLLRFVSRHSYGVFAAYRVLLGIAVLVLVFTRG